MPSNNEVTIARAALKRAAAKTAGEQHDERDLALLYMEDDRFAIETPATVTRLKAAGHWAGMIAVRALELQRVISALPATKEVTLFYSNGWLLVGDERLTARVVDVV